MTTKVWFEIWNVTTTPYRVNRFDYASEMDAEIHIHRMNKPSPNEPADNYEIRQVVQTTSVANTITVEPRAIMSVEEIADNAISDALGCNRFDVKDAEDYNLISLEDQKKVNELFNNSVNCCNTCGEYTLVEELDEEGDCDRCASDRENEDFEDED